MWPKDGILKKKGLYLLKRKLNQKNIKNKNRDLLIRFTLKTQSVNITQAENIVDSYLSSL